MTDIYNFITNSELAKDIDNVLDTLIKYYVNNSANSFGSDGITNKMNELGFNVKQNNIESTLQTMEWLGIVSASNDPTKGYSKKVTPLGYYIYNNGKLADRIKQNNIDAQRQRDNIDASIKTNKNVNINMWIAVLVAIVSAAATVSQCNISEKDRQEKVKKAEMQISNHRHFHCRDEHQLKNAICDTTNVKSSK